MGRTELTNRTDITTRASMNELQPGDRIEVTHEVKVGQQLWTTTTVGAVDRIERRRHGLHFRRAGDDKSFSDLVVMRLDDGSITSLTFDEYTVFRVL